MALTRKSGGALLLATVAAAGIYVGMVSPADKARAEVESEIARLNDSSAVIEASLPPLRAQLVGIAPQVEYLRALAAQVPATIDQPALLAELEAAAKDAGLGKPADLSVSVPQLLAADGQSVDAEGNPVIETAPLASFRVTMTVRGTTAQVAKFLENIETGSRLSVTTASQILNDSEGTTVATVVATFYLQQVPVEEIATQIEALLAQVG